MAENFKQLGDSLKARIDLIAQGLASGKVLRVGFLEGATETSRSGEVVSVPMIAAINEFGGTVNVPEHEQSIFRSVDKNGDFNKNGKFVRKDKSNFETTHVVPAHTITIPPRPFFRNMIAKNKNGWGATLASELARNKYDARKSLSALGAVCQGQLQESIADFVDPPNAKSTIAKKGFDKPLTDSGQMQQAADFEVAD